MDILQNLIASAVIKIFRFREVINVFRGLNQSFFCDEKIDSEIVLFHVHLNVKLKNESSKEQ